MKILFFYSIVASVINYFQFLDQDNNVFYYIFTTVESIAFVGFLFFQINNHSVRRVILVIGAAQLLFNVVYSIFTTDTSHLDSIPIGVETIIMLPLAYYFLYERTNDTSTLYIYSTFAFWIVIGMVLYLSGSFFIYLFGSSMTKAEVDKHWWLTNLLSFLKNIFFTVGIIVNSKPSKKLPPPDFDFAA